MDHKCPFLSRVIQFWESTHDFHSKMLYWVTHALSCPLCSLAAGPFAMLLSSACRFHDGCRRVISVLSATPKMPVFQGKWQTEQVKFRVIEWISNTSMFSKSDRVLSSKLYESLKLQFASLQGSSCALLFRKNSRTIRTLASNKQVVIIPPTLSLRGTYHQHDLWIALEPLCRRPRADRKAMSRAAAKTNSMTIQGQPLHLEHQLRRGGG